MKSSVSCPSLRSTSPACSGFGASVDPSSFRRSVMLLGQATAGGDERLGLAGPPPPDHVVLETARRSLLAFLGWILALRLALFAGLQAAAGRRRRILPGSVALRELCRLTLSKAGDRELGHGRCTAECPAARWGGASLEAFRLARHGRTRSVLNLARRDPTMHRAVATCPPTGLDQDHVATARHGAARYLLEPGPRPLPRGVGASSARSPRASPRASCRTRSSCSSTRRS